jgi:hypothetical protein
LKVNNWPIKENSSDCLQKSRFTQEFASEDNKTFKEKAFTKNYFAESSD